MKPLRNASFLLLLFVAALPLHAQVLYGSLTGTVDDASGAGVPGGAIVVANTGTGQSRSATTNATGVYLLADLLQGHYDLTVTANGFRAYTRKGIEVTVNSVRREDVALQVGQVSEGITVSAQAQALQTDKTDLHTDLNADAVTNLPLPHYRNFQSLVNLVPGATPSTLQNSLQVSPERGLSTNVNGVNRNNNATRIDGVLSVYLWLSSHVAYVPPAETVETVNISTNSFDAEQGMAGGVEMNVISKSGTNELHGSAFAFNNNSAVEVKNFFNSGAKPQTNINIYGFTLGGPIKKNKLFLLSRLGGHARAPRLHRADDGCDARSESGKFQWIQGHNLRSFVDDQHGWQRTNAVSKQHHSYEPAQSYCSENSIHRPAARVARCDGKLFEFRPASAEPRQLRHQAELQSHRQRDDLGQVQLDERFDRMCWRFGRGRRGPALSR